MDVTAALRSARPLSIANVASYVVEAATDGLMRSVVTRERLPDLAHLVDELMDQDGAEATALLHAIAALAPDVALSQYIRAELDQRSHRLAEDITGLTDLRVVDAWLLPDEDGIGETWVLGLRGPGVATASASAYVDHRFASGIKCACVSDSAPEELMADLPVLPGRTLTFERVPLADAGAKLRHALARYAEFQQEIRPADSWPGHRPLFTHVVRSLPDGGEGYPYAMHTPPANGRHASVMAKERTVQALTDAFCDSAFRSGLLPDDDIVMIADLCGTLGVEYLGSPGAAWTADVVAWTMLWGLPATLDPTDPAYAVAPRVFSDFIRFWHGQGAVSAADTEAALAVVRMWERAYFERAHDPVIARRRAVAAQVSAARSA